MLYNAITGFYHGLDENFRLDSDSSECGDYSVFSLWVDEFLDSSQLVYVSLGSSDRRIS